MSATLTCRQVGDVVVVDIEGKITLGEGAISLREEVRKLVEKGKRKIILNLADTVYVDSSGICQLVSEFTRLSNCDGTLKLLSLTTQIKDLLLITKLYTVFEVFETEAEAVASFD